MWNLRQGGAAAAAAVFGGAALHPRRSLLSAAGGRRRHSLNPHGLFPPGCSLCRTLRSSAALGGSKNLLKKFLSRNKKKFWYDSPTLGSHLVYKKPSNLARVLNLAPPKVKKEDSIRKRALNVLLLKAVRDILSTCDAGQEAYDITADLSKASLTSDFSTCRIYWRTTGNIEQDDYIDKILNNSARRIRHLLITQQVLGTVPSIVFVRDKEDASIREIEMLLETIDLGPPDEENELIQNDISEPSSTMATSSDTSDSPTHSNLFGIDHEALHKQITEYKKTKKNKEIEGIGLLEQQQEQLAEIQKQKKMRKKVKKHFDNDITPQKYLMDKHWNDYKDSETGSFENESENELQEIENELEVDNKKQ